MKTTQRRQSHTQKVSDSTTKEIRTLTIGSMDAIVREIHKNQSPVASQKTNCDNVCFTTQDVFRNHNWVLMHNIMASDEPTESSFSDYNEDFEKPICEFKFLNN